ncbi:right-handed parallel beta-helix repeat-containing protein [Catalinimonas sp. 4WD22]|uniref:right-handed parallel beta-helix repeat-containing protein n=1 Tax=Catalinimonas locisalis TaxID=3133978 RepID=UPI0031017078
MRSIRFFLMAAWLCLSLGAFAQTTTYQVAPFPVGNDNNDGINNPLATITEAIDRAADNDIIKVLAGEYEEGNILVNKPLTITGLGENASLAPAVGDTQLFNITVGGVTIVGLELIGNTNANAILLGGGNGLTIRQNTISGFASGIVVAQNAGVSISNNFINNNTNGIQIETGASITGTISENNLSGNTNKAILNGSGVLVNAPNNWWSSEGSILQDVTGSITGNIEYSPWLKLSTDTELQTEGFQPNFAALAIYKRNNDDPELLDNAFSALDESGQLTLYGSTISFNALDVDKAATLIGVTYNNNTPVIENLSVSLINNNGVSINNVIQVNEITLNSGNIIVDSEQNGRLRLTDQAIEGLSEQNGRIIGRVTSIPKNVPANETFSALGITIAPNDETGSDALTNLFVERITGGAGIIQNQVNGETFQSIRTYWNISVDNDNFSSRSLTLSWSSIYDNNVFPSVAIVWKNSGSEIVEDNWVQVNEIPINAVVSATERSIEVDVSSFSQYTVSDVNKPLPVELTSFSASLLEPHVELNWETASEINSDFFAVERSENGKDFKEVGRLKAAGNSNVPLEYRYIDEQVANRLSGSVFYRLRTVDFDGSFEYSDITTVTLSDDDIPMITAFAREGQQSLKLFTRAIEPGDYRVWITDLSGRKVFEQDLQLAPKESYELGVGSLSQSIYLIRCEGKQLALSNKFRVEEVD